MPEINQQSISLLSDEEFLDTLGLSIEMLREIVQETLDHHNELSPLAPNVYRGGAIWGMGTALLRDRLLSLDDGWEVHRKNNDEQLIHKAKGVSITVKRGDANTGLPFSVASQKSPAGASIQNAVNVNRQMLLFPELKDDGNADFIRLFLLIHINDFGEARAELSLPDQLSDNKTKFLHAARRIPIPMDNTFDIEVETSQEPPLPLEEFDIQLKSS